MLRCLRTRSTIVALCRTYWSILQVLVVHRRSREVAIQYGSHIDVVSAVCLEFESGLGYGIVLNNLQLRTLFGRESGVMEVVANYELLIYNGINGSLS